MLCARTFAWASAVKVELSFRRTFLIIILFNLALHSFIVVLEIIYKNVEEVGMVFQDIAEFILAKCWDGFLF